VTRPSQNSLHFATTAEPTLSMDDGIFLGMKMNPEAIDGFEFPFDRCRCSFIVLSGLRTDQND
jgi:hypothetical protein